MGASNREVLVRDARKLLVCTGQWDIALNKSKSKLLTGASEVLTIVGEIVELAVSAFQRLRIWGQSWSQAIGKPGSARLLPEKQGGGFRLRSTLSCERLLIPLYKAIVRPYLGYFAWGCDLSPK